MLKIAIGWIAMLCGGCGDRAATSTATRPTETAERRISSALGEVLNRADSPFVIIEHRATNKFLQFAGSSDEPLSLDLPTQALLPDERMRADALFMELGGSQSEEGFQLGLGRDPDEAAAIALRIFREVYELPEDAVLDVHVDS